KQMGALIRAGRLYLAMPPLYRITAGKESVYARDDAHKEALINGEFKSRKVDISRFKGLGEMMAQDLKDTTMNPATRTLARVVIDDKGEPAFEKLVETLMGKKAELRFNYIQEHAKFVQDVDV